MKVHKKNSHCLTITGLTAIRTSLLPKIQSRNFSAAPFSPHSHFVTPSEISRQLPPQSQKLCNIKLSKYSRVRFAFIANSNDANLYDWHGLMMSCNIYIYISPHGKMPCTAGFYCLFYLAELRKSLENSHSTSKEKTGLPRSPHRLSPKG